MSSEIVMNFILPVVVFAIGACVGSFLNVVIYRVPRGITLKKSSGSYCPECKKKIPARFNIPLRLRGKCKWCKTKFKSQYFLVEFLTAVFYLAIYLLFLSTVGVGGVVALWILASLTIAVAFIDFEHMVIPDAITLRGLGIGLIFSTLVPALHQESIWYNGLFSGLVGAATGFVLLWIIVRMSKLFFGRIKHQFSNPADFNISQSGGKEDSLLIQLGPNVRYQWNDVFFRRGDKLIMDVAGLQFNQMPQAVKKQFYIAPDGFVIDGVKTRLDTISSVSGKCSRAVVPREVVGFGNVKFVAMIGAFVGWQAVLVTTLAAFVIVALMRRFLKGNKVPFSPFLALGALIFILFKLT